MTAQQFFDFLCEEVKQYKNILETQNNQWIVKGFIDVYKNVYTITNDTKVVSKIIEILLIPQLNNFARKHDLELELPSKQNFYPDLTFKDTEGHLFAVDFKSSYYDGEHVNGLTLGSYWGYFRNRDVVKNMDHAYNEYSAHIVLGMLYAAIFSLNNSLQFIESQYFENSVSFDIVRETTQPLLKYWDEAKSAIMSNTPTPTK